VANAILDGTDAIMLSGETAAGKYPVLAVETMARIGCEVELAQDKLPRRVTAIETGPELSISHAVAHASVTTAADLGAKAILAPTASGQTARTIARFRPGCPIVAATPDPCTQRQLAFIWGVYPVLAPPVDNTDQVLRESIEAARRQGYVSRGDVVVITGGSEAWSVGSTHMMKVHVVE
jgi:pyruvate kinase